MRRALKKQHEISEARAKSEMVSERARKCRNTCSVQVGDVQTPSDCKAGEGFQRRHSLTGRESMPDTGREETGQKGTLRPWLQAEKVTPD